QVERGGAHPPQVAHPAHDLPGHLALAGAPLPVVREPGGDQGLLERWWGTEPQRRPVAARPATADGRVGPPVRRVRDDADEGAAGDPRGDRDVVAGVVVDVV